MAVSQHGNKKTTAAVLETAAVDSGIMLFS
jgi:hypothetical protein